MKSRSRQVVSHIPARSNALGFLLIQNRWRGGSGRARSSLLCLACTCPSHSGLWRFLPHSTRPSRCLWIWPSLPLGCSCSRFQNTHFIYPSGAFSVVTFSRSFFLTVLFGSVTLITQELPIGGLFLLVISGDTTGFNYWLLGFSLPLHTPHLGFMRLAGWHHLFSFFPSVLDPASEMVSGTQ